MKRAALLALVLGCSRQTTPAPPDAAPAVAASAPPVASALPAASAPPVVSGAPSAPPAPELAAMAACASDAAPPKSATSIGHTSVVFKVVLADGRKAAWKPDAVRRRFRYRGELASYRLGVALGLAANVPVACPRTFTKGELAAALAGDARGAALLGEEVVADGSVVHGALMPWIDGLSFWAIEAEPARTEVAGWLAHGPLPEARRDRARQVSDLVVFDYLTTNWDRYSGGNVGLDRTGETVLFVDNDAAFMASPPKESLARARARLDATERFSRALVDALGRLDEAALGRILGEENGHPLLDASAVHALELRREEVLDLVRAKQKARGDAETLAFP